MKRAFWAILLAVSACPVWGQEISVFMGAEQWAGTDRRSAAGQIEYRDDFNGNFAWSFSYLNEGHFPNHHRDGALGELWFCTNSTGPRFSLGAGPYYYFDTTIRPGDTSYSNDHGLGVIASIDAAWHAGQRVFFHVRGSWIETARSIDTLSIMFGAGYRFSGRPASEPAPRYESAGKNEISVLPGRAIVNSFKSERATAVSIEYRRRLRPCLDWTVSWLYEGHNSALTRNGFSTQLWGVREFPEERVALGAGAGLYRATDLDSPEKKEKNRVFSGIVSLTGSYRLDRHWDIRAILNRIVTSYNKDSDIIVGGIGYRF